MNNKNNHSFQHMMVLREPKLKLSKLLVVFLEKPVKMVDIFAVLLLSHESDTIYMRADVIPVFS